MNNASGDKDILEQGSCWRNMAEKWMEIDEPRWLQQHARIAGHSMRKRTCEQWQSRFLSKSKDREVLIYLDRDKEDWTKQDRLIWIKNKDLYGEILCWFYIKAFWQWTGIWRQHLLEERGPIMKLLNVDIFCLQIKNDWYKPEVTRAQVNESAALKASCPVTRFVEIRQIPSNLFHHTRNVDFGSFISEKRSYIKKWYSVISRVFQSEAQLEERQDTTERLLLSIS